MMLTVFDYLAIGTILLFATISLFRGVVHELVELVSWVLAFAGARVATAPLGAYLATHVQPPAFASVLAFVLIFVGIRVGMQLVQAILERALDKIGLSGLNRGFGALFGAVKGILAVTLAVLVCSFTHLPQSPDWKKSQTAFVFEGLAVLAVPYLPAFLAGKIHNQPLSRE